MYETQYNNNFKRIQTKFDNNADLSDDNVSRDELVKTKGQFILEGKVNNGEPVHFHIKISEKFL